MDWLSKIGQLTSLTPHNCCVTFPLDYFKIIVSCLPIGSKTLLRIISISCCLASHFNCLKYNTILKVIFLILMLTSWIARRCPWNFWKSKFEKNLSFEKKDVFKNRYLDFFKLMLPPKVSMGSLKKCRPIWSSQIEIWK